MDLLRIDHFRALAAHWSVPAGAPDARGGTWKRTPGRMFLKVLREECGDLPIVAEDLGVITPDVEALRKGFGLPGMRVLQFGFGGDPQTCICLTCYERDCIVYTGTHDNDTTLGWFLSLDSETQRRVEFFLRLTPGAMPDALIRAALASVGKLAIIPMQDVLGLGSEARLNTPGTAVGNWTWRLPAGALNADLATPSRPAEQGVRASVTPSHAQSLAIGQRTWAFALLPCVCLSVAGEHSQCVSTVRSRCRHARCSQRAARCFVPKLETPKLSVVNVELQKSDLWEQRMKVRMRVVNPNDRPIPGEGPHRGARRAGAGARAWRVRRVVQRAGARRSRVRHEHDGQHGRRALKLLGTGNQMGDEVDYRVTGKISLSEGLLRSIPFEDRGTFKSARN